MRNQLEFLTVPGPKWKPKGAPQKIPFFGGPSSARDGNTRCFPHGVEHLLQKVREGRGTTKYVVPPTNPTSQLFPTLGMVIYHVVLRRGYEDISGFVVGLGSAGDILCCEHTPDAEEKTIHCHLVVESSVTAEAIRKRIKIAGLDGRGQYAIMEKTKKTRVPYGRNELLKYVLKGLEREIPRQSSLKYSKGFTEIEIEEAKMTWIPSKLTSEEDEEKKSSKTHYSLIKEIYAEAPKTTRLVRDEFGNLINEQCVENNVGTWHLMCKKLNENEIRTSSHELERFYITLLRQDPLHQENLYTNLMKKMGW